MAIVAKIVTKAANVDASIDLGVGKKLYGICRKYGVDVYVLQNGTEARLLDNSIVQQFFPVPLEFAASSTLVFKGTGAATISVLVEE